MRRARSRGIDLSMPFEQIRQFMLDDVFMADCLFVILQEDCRSKGISAEQFDAGLDCKLIETARGLLVEALIEYYDEGKAEMLRAAVATLKEELAKVTRSLTSIGSIESRES